ncbi:hypothetical protein D3874_04940 [Oleomonas cavernae]|uniref:Uncharacterized protein n=2 Tax=Oleomonas cavernae TaxID=2320859 RepID=A0A418W942_9PROT|nr:hypothetical protein D3874_04940 [Oleomonas cavernae]
MNHPDDHVIFEILRRLLGRFGIYAGVPESIRGFKYTLNSLIVPELTFVRQRYRLLFPEQNNIRGTGIRIDSDFGGSDGIPLVYNWSMLVGAYFRLYDHVFKEDGASI